MIASSLAPFQGATTDLLLTGGIASLNHRLIAATPPGLLSNRWIMAKARPSSAEIDRFLEEVNRRKQQQARQNAPPPQVQQPPKPKAQAAPKPVRVQQRQVQQRQVMDQEPLVRAVVIDQIPEPMRDVVNRPAASAYQITPPAPIVPRGTESAPIHHAKALMASRDGMRAVFVLNEILSPPRCIKPYKRLSD